MLAQLLDHLVGAQQGCFRNSEAKRLGGLEVNGQLEQGWLLDRQLSRLLTTQNSGDVICRTTPERSKVRAVADETAIATAPSLFENSEVDDTEGERTHKVSKMSQHETN